MLEFNGTAIILGISFVIFVILENLIFYRPLKKVLTQRADYIKENEASADESYNTAKNLIEQRNQKIAVANEKSAEILSDTTAKEQNKFDTTIKEVKNSSNNTIEETKNRLQEEKIQVQNELKKEIGLFASGIISKILKKEVSVVNINDEVVEKAIRGEI